MANRTAVTIRPATIVDLDDILDLFASAVERLTTHDYNAAQRRAWMRGGRRRRKWMERLENQYFIIAESSAEKLVGFGSIDAKVGYLDTLYVHPAFAHRGIARVLLEQLEEHAGLSDIDTIVVDASKTARPFFQKNNYRLVRHNELELNGVSLVNYRMSKRL